MTEISRETIDRACKAYADATGYYGEFHSGLSSPSADKMREGIRAALNAVGPLSHSADAGLVEALTTARAQLVTLGGEPADP